MGFAFYVGALADVERDEIRTRMAERRSHGHLE
jgi:hypothetical protein